MGNPFKKLKSVGKALKIGYAVLQKYESLEATGLVPVLKIKGVPITAIDNAAEAFVRTIRREHEEGKSGE